MSNIAIKGAVTGTGVFTLESPATNTDRTLTIPDVDGSIVTANALGNVGIGTDSPTNTLHILADTPSILIQDSNSAGTAATGYIDFVDSAASRLGYIGYASGVNSDLDINVTQSGRMDFSTNNTLRARIEAGGNLLVATSVVPSAVAASGSGAMLSTLAGLVQNYSGNGAANYLNKTDWVSGTTYMFSFRVNGTTCGTISSTNGTSTSYNTSSDYRLKEDWVAIADASTRVNALKPVNFAWKVNGERVDGFLAHELADVVPEAVTGSKDATEMVDITDEEGNVTGQEERPVYQGIDQSKLVPLLTAALQEALARIETLEADVATLKGGT